MFYDYYVIRQRSQYVGIINPSYYFTYLPNVVLNITEFSGAALDCRDT